MSGASTRMPGDRALLLGLLLALAVAASLTPIRNFDFWWHLATGRLILERHSLPRQDPYSFTAEGTPWVDHEWLFQVLAYLGMTAAGPQTLVLLKVAAVLLVGLLAASHLAREGHGPAGMALLLLPTFLGAAFRLDVRPELCTLVLVPLGLYLVLRSRDGGSLRPLFGVPALVALGANLHVGILLLPAILGLGACATFLSERFMMGGRSDRKGAQAGAPFAGRLAMTTIAAALAAGLNPYGFRIYAVPARVASLVASLPSPNLEWARPEPRQFPLFFLAGAALVVVVVLARHRLDPIAAPAALVAAGLAAAHLRHIGLFFFLLPFGLARPARALAAAAQRRDAYRIGTVGGQVRPGFVAAAVLLVTGIPALALIPPRIVWGLGVASGNEPRGAADFLAREGVGERLFNDVLFGGYLIWRRYPVRQVFIDGRNEVYAPLLTEIFGSLDDERAWARLLDRYRIDSALLRYPPALERVVTPAAAGRSARFSERAFSALHFPAERWALVYWDDDGMIFLRRIERYRSIIGRLEYRALNPDDWRYAYAGALTRRRDIAPILDDLRRKLTEDPSCERARTLLRAFTGLAEALPGPGSRNTGSGG